MKSAKDFLGFLFRNFIFLDKLAYTPLDAFHSFVNEFLFHVIQENAITCCCCKLCNTMTHRACTNDCYCFHNSISMYRAAFLIEFPTKKFVASLDRAVLYRSIYYITVQGFAPRRYNYGTILA